MIQAVLSTVRTAVLIVFALSVLLSTQAHAQSIVGTWTNTAGDNVWIYQANGRWSLTVSSPPSPLCGTGAVPGAWTVRGGTYTASVGSMSMWADIGLSCSTGLSYTATSPGFLGSGSYSVTGNTLAIHLTNSAGSSNYSLTLAGTAAIATPTTPLPPPPTTQTVFTVPVGQLPTAAVSVNPSGTFGNATLVVTLDLSQVLSGGSFAGQGQFAAGYNIYVAALAPSGALGLPSATWFVLPATHSWALLSIPIAAYMEGLAQNATNTVAITVLQGLDVTGLVGAEIYIGYGTSDTEMLTAGRYRGVYKVQ